jgi:hypothetical protein
LSFDSVIDGSLVQRFGLGVSQSFDPAIDCEASVADLVPVGGLGMPLHVPEQLSEILEPSAVMIGSLFMVCWFLAQLCRDRLRRGFVQRRFDLADRLAGYPFDFRHQRLAAIAARIAATWSSVGSPSSFLPASYGTRIERPSSTASITFKEIKSYK